MRHLNLLAKLQKDCFKKKKKDTEEKWKMELNVYDPIFKHFLSSWHIA